MKRVKICKPKSKPTPIQAWTGSEDSSWLRFPGFLEHRHMKAAKLSALSTGRLNPSRDIPGTHFCCRLSRLESHTATGRFKLIKNFSDTIGNRTRNLTNLTAVFQKNASSRAPKFA